MHQTWGRLSLIYIKPLFQCISLSVTVLPCTTVKNLDGRLLLAFKRWKQGWVICEGQRSCANVKEWGYRSQNQAVCSWNRQGMWRTKGLPQLQKEDLLLNRAEILVTKDMEKGRSSLCWLCLGLYCYRTAFGNRRPLRPVRKARARKISPLLRRIKLRNA